MSFQPPKLPPPEPLSTPPLWPDKEKRWARGFGMQIDEVKRLKQLEPAEFEVFVEQYAYYLDNSKRYAEVLRSPGAGDQGRDVIAYIDPFGTPRRRWDNYQCKRYQTPLSPAHILPELAKLCYYTFIGEYSVPENYFLVCNSGIGPTLAKYIDGQNPEKLREALIEAWKGDFSKKLTGVKPIPLVGKLKTYVENFDFTIIRSVGIQKLLEEHGKTPYHHQIFGSQLKPRPAPLIPPEEILSSEIPYVTQIFEAYSDHKKQSLTKPSDLLENQLEELHDHYHEQRECFWFSETLKGFTRDNFEPGNKHFEELSEQMLKGLNNTLLQTHSDGFTKMLDVAKTAGTLQLGHSPILEDLRQEDRIGICHQLANENRLRWTKRK